VTGLLQIKIAVASQVFRWGPEVFEIQVKEQVAQEVQVL
jgi:hypothetical protein